MACTIVYVIFFLYLRHAPSHLNIKYSMGGFPPNLRSRPAGRMQITFRILAKRADALHLRPI